MSREVDAPAGPVEAPPGERGDDDVDASVRRPDADDVDASVRRPDADDVDARVRGPDADDVDASVRRPGVDHVVAREQVPVVRASERGPLRGLLRHFTGHLGSIALITAVAAIAVVLLGRGDLLRWIAAAVAIACAPAAGRQLAAGLARPSTPPRLRALVERLAAALPHLALAGLALMLLGELALGHPPATRDHAIHYFHTRVSVDALVEHGRVIGFSDRLGQGYAFGENYPFLPYLWAGAAHLVSFGLVALRASYALGILAMWATMIAAIAWFTRLTAATLVGPGRIAAWAGTIGAALWLLDPGASREGGWHYLMFHGVWPQLLSTALWTLSLPLTWRALQRPSPRRLALAALALAGALLSHPFALLTTAASAFAWLLVLLVMPAPKDRSEATGPEGQVSRDSPEDRAAGERRAPGALVGWALIHGVAALCAAGWLAAFFASADTLGRSPVPWRGLGEAATDLIAGELFVHHRAIVGPLALLGLGLALRRPRPLALCALALLIGLLVLASDAAITVLRLDLVTAAFKNLQFPRYAIALKPIWAAFAGIGGAAAIAAIARLDRPAIHTSRLDASTLDARTFERPTAGAPSLDAPTLDAATLDVSKLDATTLDASTPDASTPDASTRDAATRDASTRDAATRDAATRDAPRDAATRDALGSARTIAGARGIPPRAWLVVAALLGPLAVALLDDAGRLIARPVGGLGTLERSEHGPIDRALAELLAAEGAREAAEGRALRVAFLRLGMGGGLYPIFAITDAGAGLVLDGHVPTINSVYRIDRRTPEALRALGVTHVLHDRPLGPTEAALAGSLVPAGTAGEYTLARLQPAPSPRRIPGHIAWPVADAEVTVLASDDPEVRRYQVRGLAGADLETILAPHPKWSALLEPEGGGEAIALSQRSWPQSAGAFTGQRVRVAGDGVVTLRFTAPASESRAGLVSLAALLLALVALAGGRPLAWRPRLGRRVRAPATIAAGLVVVVAIAWIVRRQEAQLAETWRRGPGWSGEATLVRDLADLSALSVRLHPRDPCDGLDGRDPHPGCSATLYRPRLSMLYQRPYLYRCVEVTIPDHGDVFLRIPRALGRRFRGVLGVEGDPKLLRWEIVGRRNLGSFASKKVGFDVVSPGERLELRIHSGDHRPREVCVALAEVQAP